jgi:hypothetical protein
MHRSFRYLCSEYSLSVQSFVTGINSFLNYPETPNINIQQGGSTEGRIALIGFYGSGLLFAFIPSLIARKQPS